MRAISVNSFLILILVLLSGDCLFGFRANSWKYFHGRNLKSPQQFIHFAIEDGISIDTLTSIEKEGQYLSRSITKWLNEEYIPLEIHRTIGQAVGDCYLNYRRIEQKNARKSDLGSFILTVGQELEQKVNFYDAYVNAWDVANRSSDLLLLIMNRELCECAGDLQSAKKIAQELGLLPSSTPGGIATGSDRHSEASLLVNTSVGLFRKLDYDRLINNFKNEFSRYFYLQSLLQEEKVDWLQLNRLVALMVGFQFVKTTSSLQQSPPQYQFLQNSTLAPPEWTSLSQPPDFSDLNNKKLNPYLLAYMPRNHKDMNTLMESMLGYVPYQHLLKSTDPVIIRKILIAKWFYLKGFLTAPFPPEERYELPLDETDEYEDRPNDEEEGKSDMYKK